MRFVDRKEELARLMRLSDAHKGGFAVLWGRRRIGKSELLKEWCRIVSGLYTVADRSLPAVQRLNFATAIDSFFPGFGDVLYPNWKVLFEALSRRAIENDWHGPLAIDEFPYWVEADQSIVSVLQNWIDAEKSRGGILLAIAGSSQHMMQGIAIDHDSPLYGRAGEKIKLQPISFSFIGEALGITDTLEQVKAYSIWGGVPRYWVAAEQFGQNLDDAVDELALNPLGLFHDEPSTILQSEIPSAISLKPYLDVIGAGASRVSEIAGILGIQATALSKPLARLVELGLVKREVPYGENEKNSKKSLYRIADHFCHFWFNVIASRHSIFDFAPTKIRRQIWQKYSNNIFAATWEELARQCVVSSERLASFAGKNDYWMPAGRWWSGNEHELDVVAFNGTKDKVLIGEAKWSSTPFSLKDVEMLIADFTQITPPQSFPPQIQRTLFLSATAPDVPDTVQNIPIFTATTINN